jgi:V/A-type H+/Na+-transporting ATPase subunit A
MSGVVRRVSGPLIEADGLDSVAVAELVHIGQEGMSIPAEVVARSGGRAVVQAYEYTGGVRPGDEVRRLGRPLAAPLGPGLLGGVFDGLLRPLDDAPQWLIPGSTGDLDGRDWEFAPAQWEGREAGPGDILGTVAGAGPVEHRVLVPPGVRGTATVRPAGRYRSNEPIARVGATDIPLLNWWPVRQARPFTAYATATEPLLTGQRVIDVLFPVVKGGSAAVPGGFGTGKTVLLQQLAKWADADVIVYVGCGERGNELADVLDELRELPDPKTGGRVADRTVIIANTSNMPIMAREASIYTGVTVAEFYRDMGYDTVVIADSTSRWAEALREFASRNGDLPAEEGYPAGLASALAAFYERGGQVTTLGGRDGSVTIVGAVSPPGGDLTEPVTSYTERFVRTLWSLDRDLAYARHYPAVSWSGSYCRDVGAVGDWHAGHGDPGWAPRRAKAAGILADSDRVAALVELVGLESLPGNERIALLGGRLLREGVLVQNATSANDQNCSQAKAAALLESVLSVVDDCAAKVAQGLPAAAIERLDFGPLLRAREDSGPDDADAVRTAAEGVRRQVREVQP